MKFDIAKSRKKQRYGDGRFQKSFQRQDESFRAKPDTPPPTDRHPQRQVHGKITIVDHQKTGKRSTTLSKRGKETTQESLQSTVLKVLIQQDHDIREIEDAIRRFRKVNQMVNIFPHHMQSPERGSPRARSGHLLLQPDQWRQNRELQKKRLNRSCHPPGWKPIIKTSVCN